MSDTKPRLCASLEQARRAKDNYRHSPMIQNLGWSYIYLAKRIRSIYEHSDIGDVFDDLKELLDEVPKK